MSTKVERDPGIMEIDLTRDRDGGDSKPGMGNERGGGGGGNNRDRGPKRKRGGGPQGPGRNSFMGRGGGGGGGQGGRGDGGGGHQHHHNDRRNFHNSNDNFDGPMNKRQKILSPEQRFLEKIRSLQGPSADLPPKKFEAKKFLANTRLYVGNIASECTENELKEMFATFGEIEELFLNREKNFAFLKMDYRTSAERARSELDQKNIKGRQIKVRFAPANVRVKVKNLSPMVSNELLEIAFSVFGDIERALVFVDEKGKSLCEGIVDFTRKNHAIAAHKYCQDKAYFLTTELRPVITEMGEMYEADEGLLEMNLPKREFGKDRQPIYYKEREHGPRVADDGSFEHNYATKWKELVAEYKNKELALKAELEKDLEKMQTQMELERYDYETEMLRQQLRQREIDQERHKMEWEQRRGGGNGPMFGGGGGGGGGGGNFPNGGRGGDDRPVARDPQMQLPDQESDNADNGIGNIGGPSLLGHAYDFEGRMNMPLAPPPMPPSGLMAHLQGLADDDGNGGNQPGPTWEIGPFGFGQMGGSFGQQQQQQQFRSNNQREGLVSRFGNRGGRGGGGGGQGGRGGNRGGGGNGHFRGGRGGR